MDVFCDYICYELTMIIYLRCRAKSPRAGHPNNATVVAASIPPPGSISTVLLPFNENGDQIVLAGSDKNFCPNLICCLHREQLLFSPDHRYRITTAKSFYKPIFLASSVPQFDTIINSFFSLPPPPLSDRKYEHVGREVDVRG